MPELAVSYLYWTQQGLSDVAGILQLAAQVEAPPRVERNVSGCRTTKPSRPPDPMAGLWEEAFQGCVWVFPCRPVSPSAARMEAGWLALTSTCRWIAFGPLLYFNYLPTFKMRKSHIRTETRLLACFKAWGGLGSVAPVPCGFGARCVCLLPTAP